ncbi:amidase family protein, partial [Candidatus Bathyarchaeota archaeon]|nr:amidase family protein [Candidatus Bathyarchaeota archaeon]
MNESEISGLTITEASRLIGKRALSPLELTRAALARIRRMDATLRAFITVTDDLALRQAERAEREVMRGEYKGPLHGIPICLKDLYFTRGERTTAGSRILKDFVPDYDSTVASRLYQAGAVLLGKTNLDEFALGCTTNNPHYGTCLNPWNLDHVPGGSSGGSAVAVATAMGLASMGSDTGGSVRIPAAFCGVVGFKPTFGLVSRWGVIPESWSMDHCGPITRTVADSALLLQAVAGYDVQDPFSARQRIPSYRRRLRGGMEGIRIGVPRNYYSDIVDVEIEQAVHRAVGHMESLGAQIREVVVPHVESAFDIVALVAWAEAASYHRTWLQTRPEEYSP